MHAMERVPLDRYRLVDTRSVDDAREAIGRIFCPHFLTPTARDAAGFHAQHNAVRQPGYSVNYVTYGGSVEIDPGELTDFFLLQIPVAGSAHVRCGRTEAEAVPEVHATLLSPTLATRMTWRDGCRKLIVQIDRMALEKQFAALAGAAPAEVEFVTGLALSGSQGAALLRHVGMMFEAAEMFDDVSEAYRVMLRDGLTTLLLTGFEHNRRRAFDRPAADAGPMPLRKAAAFIFENLAGPLPAAEIAAAAGVSLRSLQDGFRRGHGVTIGEFILNARLDLFRSLLVSGGPSPLTVTEAALSAGLGHVGRAAQAYRRRFGELPSETLSRRR